MEISVDGFGLLWRPGRRPEHEVLPELLAVFEVGLHRQVVAHGGQVDAAYAAHEAHAFFQLDDADDVGLPFGDAVAGDHPRIRMAQAAALDPVPFEGVAVWAHGPGW